MGEEEMIDSLRQMNLDVRTLTAGLLGRIVPPDPSISTSHPNPLPSLSTPAASLGRKAGPCLMCSKRRAAAAVDLEKLPRKKVSHD